MTDSNVIQLIINRIDSLHKDVKDDIAELKKCIESSTDDCDSKITDISGRVRPLEEHHIRQQGFLGATKKYGGWLVAIVTTALSMKQ